MSEQDESRQHRRGLVEDLAAAGEGDGDAVEPTRPDGDGNEDHHVEGAGLQSPISAVEKDPGRVEHHWQAQYQGEYVVAESERGGNCERSEEHTSELQSLMRISYAVFCLKKKKQQQIQRIRKTAKNDT